MLCSNRGGQVLVAKPVVVVPSLVGLRPTGHRRDGLGQSSEAMRFTKVDSPRVLGDQRFGILHCLPVREPAQQGVHPDRHPILAAGDQSPGRGAVSMAGAPGFCARRTLRLATMRSWLCQTPQTVMAMSDTPNH